MRAVLAALLVLIIAPKGFGQITSATISGTVKDQTQAILPGVDVVVKNGGTKLNINGMSFRSNSYLLDGANMRGYAGTATVSAAETTLGVETIQEFRVVTNAYSADYGRAMGGVISLVTKAGTNTLHGSGFEFFRDSKFDARNVFDRGEAAPLERNQFGASF